MVENFYCTLIGGKNDGRSITVPPEAWSRGILIVPVWKGREAILKGLVSPMERIETEAYTRRMFQSGEHAWSLWVHHQMTDAQAFAMLLARYEPAHEKRR